MVVACTEPPPLNESAVGSDRYIQVLEKQTGAHHSGQAPSRC